MSGRKNARCWKQSWQDAHLRHLDAVRVNTVWKIYGKNVSRFWSQNVNSKVKTQNLGQNGFYIQMSKNGSNFELRFWLQNRGYFSSYLSLVHEQLSCFQQHVPANSRPLHIWLGNSIRVVWNKLTRMVALPILKCRAIRPPLFMALCAAHFGSWCC